MWLFSYSDENFTVVGNLCFVHILLDGTKQFYDIPPAIVDRMLFKEIIGIYPFNNNKDRGLVSTDIALAIIKSGKIICTKESKSYLYCYFPIDSNK